METGELAMVTAGEVHLQKCLKDLEDLGFEDLEVFIILRFFCLILFLIAGFFSDRPIFGNSCARFELDAATNSGSDYGLLIFGRK